MKSLLEFIKYIMEKSIRSLTFSSVRKENLTLCEHHFFLKCCIEYTYTIVSNFNNSSQYDELIIIIVTGFIELCFGHLALPVTPKV